MTNSANNDAVDIKALMYALTQQREPLPQSVQRDLRTVGKALQQNQPTAPSQLRACIESYLPLDVAYGKAIQELDRQYYSQERTKSLSATFINNPGTSWYFLNEVIPAADWVATAKQAINAPTYPRQDVKAQSLEDKIIRIAIVSTGGASIGFWIAQVPGGIIGACCAFAYSCWYVSSYQKTSSRLSK